ncbi:unnamed protein product [Paramecium sonneborni]|uniref:Uncharacterized protein n=1 Tax=Paramecium sonneborni TaxID=65129 RepID=A0A8S1RP25_9CILI|nr:unnamed protein product [Paramecium sonneborni]
MDINGQILKKRFNKCSQSELIKNSKVRTQRKNNKAHQTGQSNLIRQNCKMYSMSEEYLRICYSRRKCLQLQNRRDLHNIFLYKGERNSIYPTDIDYCVTVMRCTSYQGTVMIQIIIEYISIDLKISMIIQQQDQTLIVQESQEITLKAAQRTQNQNLKLLMLKS